VAVNCVTPEAFPHYGSDAVLHSPANFGGTELVDGDPARAEGRALCDTHGNPHRDTHNHRYTHLNTPR